jgi:type III restriction enzyme
VISGGLAAPGGAGLGGQQYNPDLLVIETGGTHWIVEVKMNKEMTSADVQA